LELFGFAIKAKLAQLFYHLFYVILGLLCAVQIVQYVVCVGYGKVNNVRLQAVVNVGLERGWRVCKSERHDWVFKLALIGPERGVMLVAIFDPDKVIGDPEVKLSENQGSWHSVHHFRDTRKGEPPLDFH